MPTDEVATVNLRKPEKSVIAEARTKPRFLTRPAGWACCLTVLLAIGIVRIVATYHVFNHTIDEPSHITGGIEWWEKGTYTLETKHTPLARISVALGPFLAGVRGTGATRWQDTYPILSENGHYWRNLILGRIGVLPYFVIATLVVFFWTKRLFGTATALIAATVFTLLPTVLAHSSNATTDIPLTAMFCCSLYAFTLWLREPNVRTAAQFGITTGLALCTKLSTVVFLPLCAAPVLFTYAMSGQARWRSLLRTFVMVAVCAFFVLWAVYRFSHVPLEQVTHLPDRAAAKIFGRSSRVTGMVHAIAFHVPVPAPEFFDGIRMLRDQNKEGSRSFLFGHVKDGGWWYFFFAALALKTPIAVLLLAGMGSIFIFRQYWGNRENWEIGAPLFAFTMVMLASTPARLDSGIRYVLPVFVFLSILSASGLVNLWTHRSHPLIYKTAAGLLFAWILMSSVRAHPDYLAYFNEFGGKDPSHLIVVGDLDWGQDYARLSTYLYEHSVSQVSIASDTFFEAKPLGLPEIQLLGCADRPLGWVAMEVRRVRLHPECYSWMAQQHAVATVGKTMIIYYVQ
jgi:hypothetical protein